jgi:hypothetical protein
VDGAGAGEAAGPIRPRYGGQSLLNLPASICQALGVPAADLAPPLDPALLPPAMLEDAAAVLLVVVDGLGRWQLDRAVAAGDAPALARLAGRHAAAGDPRVGTVTSVFPSSTIPVLTTLGTGVSPAVHGLLGWTVYLEEFGEVAELARWGPAAGRGGYTDASLGGHDPAAFFGLGTLYQRLAAAGIRSMAVSPESLRGSGFTAMTLRGAGFVGYHATSSLFVLAERLLAARARAERLYVYAYWSTLDAVGHHHGPLGPEHDAELAALDFALGRWLDRHDRRGDLLVILTADHGHVPSPPGRVLRLDREPGLRDLLRAPPSGERRLAYLHARPGRATELRAYCDRRLGEAATWLDPAEALEQGLFGPEAPSPAARRRAGDGILVARDDWQLVHPLRASSEPTVFAGNHGALDPREMLVPLVALRL